MLLRAALLSPPYSTLTYSLPAALPPSLCGPGARIAVPLGNSIRVAMTLELDENVRPPENAACKDIIFPLERDALIDAETLALFQDLAIRQCATPGLAAAHALPSGLRSAKVKLSCRGAYHSLSRLRSMPDAQKGAIIEDFLQGGAFFVKSAVAGKKIEICSLACDPPWPLRPAAKRQRAILEFLFESGTAPAAQILKKFGSGAGQALAKLAEAGLVKIRAEGEWEDEGRFLPPPPAPFALNQSQNEAIANLREALLSGAPQNRLLYGVTGSGKTAVYIELIKVCMELGKSAFLLAPEVALAHKLRRDLSQALPDCRMLFYHGYQSAAQREKAWRIAAAGNGPYLVVGARSALFLPLRNAGCVILDEEHDTSFKQDEGFPYNAKEVAWFRMARASGLLLLGSATPDLKTFHAAQKGSLPVINLPARIGKKPLPPVELVDIASYSAISATPDGFGILAKESENALRECAARGEQAVILLNRRGYSPMVHCLNCAKTLSCPHCAIGLAHHKNRQALVCHFCGYTRPWPSPCPECGKSEFLPIGEGTERVAERLEVIAGRPALRLDRDSSRRPGAMEEILEAFANKESPFLVGTQMLSKGHHFPNVTLVVAADGDIGLNLPDYRAAERAFQLLVQAAGRAGRGDNPGRVLIQTRDVSHYCWHYVRGYDYEGFFHNELRRREKWRYPPFVRLALLRASFQRGENRGPAAVAELGEVLRKACPALGVSLAGPAPAPIPVLNNRMRHHCLLKADSWQRLRQAYLSALQSPCARILQLQLDLDPVNML